MIVPESQDEESVPSGSVGRGSRQQYSSISPLPQHPGSPKHSGSDGNVSAAQHEPQEYTETDFLLPDKLYTSTRLRRSTGAPAETICSMVLQILVPFLLAGLGTVSAGMLLEVVQVRKTRNTEVWLRVFKAKPSASRYLWKTEK